MSNQQEAMPLLIQQQHTADLLAYKACAENDPSSSSSSASSSLLLGDDQHHKTDTMETFLHLVKGYMGAGCLSLPWAVSQLGITGGILSIFALSVWSSYNCWTVVQLKRYMERTTATTAVTTTTETQQVEQQETANNNNNFDSDDGTNPNNTTTNNIETSSRATSNITYPDVGEWAYGTNFQHYVTICICTQQLAICTVFISFVGENLLAVFKSLSAVSTIGHATVMSLTLPAYLALSLIPSLKLLAPVMATGFILLLISLAALGVIVVEEWDMRPESTPTVNMAQVPLALCAILYSYEGINLILPVESAMKEPQHFAPVFCASMTVVAMILATVAVTCVYAFGNVTSGSVTAFLLQAFHEDHSITTWLMIANTAVSLSVLLTYPLQLFPALELLGPMLQKSTWWRKLVAVTSCCCGHGILAAVADDQDDDDNQDLSAFEPLPPLPEHDVMDEEDMEQWNIEHTYLYGGDDKNADTNINKVTDDDASFSGVSSVTGSIFPRMNSQMPGDSIHLRLILVVATYLVAVIVPNVQALISLAGALAGSSTALLIPPVLELAWMEHLEQTTSSTYNNPAVVPMSPNMARQQQANNKSSHNATNVILQQWFSGKYWAEQLKCYILLFMGIVFMFIGTYASILDILKIYMSKSSL